MKPHYGDEAHHQQDRHCSARYLRLKVICRSGEQQMHCRFVVAAIALLMSAPAQADTLYFTFQGTLTANAFDPNNLFGGNAQAGQPYSLFITANITTLFLGTNQPGAWLTLSSADFVIGNNGVAIPNDGNPFNSFAVTFGGYPNYEGDGGRFRWNDTTATGTSNLSFDFAPMPFQQLNPFVALWLLTPFTAISDRLDINHGSLLLTDQYMNPILGLSFQETQVSMSLDAPNLGGVALSDPQQIAATVPEPSTWAMMLIGFAGLGFAFRQSRRTRSASRPNNASGSCRRSASRATRILRACTGYRQRR